MTKCATAPTPMVAGTQLQEVVVNKATPILRHTLPSGFHLSRWYCGSAHLCKYRGLRNLHANAFMYPLIRISEPRRRGSRMHMYIWGSTTLPVHNVRMLSDFARSFSIFTVKSETGTDTRAQGQRWALAGIFLTSKNNSKQSDSHTHSVSNQSLSPL